MTYYNTTHLKHNELKEAIAQCTSQDGRLTILFQKNKKLSPSQAHLLLKNFTGTNVPITSVRRSINSLTRAEILEKTEDKRDGIYGRKEYVWKYIKLQDDE